MSAIANLFRSQATIDKLEADMKLDIAERQAKLEKERREFESSQKTADLLYQQSLLTLEDAKNKLQADIDDRKKQADAAEKQQQKETEAIVINQKWSVAARERNRLLRPADSQSRRLSFVVVGAQGVGKSSFINTISHTFSLPMGGDGKQEIGFNGRQKVSNSEATTLRPKTIFARDNMVFTIQDIPGYHQPDDLKAVAALLHQKAVSADAKERVDGIIRCIRIDAKDSEAEMMKEIFKMLPISDCSITIVTGVDKFAAGAARNTAIANAKRKHGVASEEVFPIENYQKTGAGIADGQPVAGSVDISLMTLAALNAIVSYSLD